MANLDSAADHADAKTASAWVPALAGAMGVALLGSLVFYFNSDQGAPGGAESAGVEISTPVTPVHPATVPSRFEQHAKQALAAEIQNLASDISGARKFLGASVRSTLPGLGD